MKTNAAKIVGGQKSGPTGPIDSIPKIATVIANLDSGLAAELRRGPLAGAGSTAYWRLLAKYDIPSSSEKQLADWAGVLQSVAILTPKGKPKDTRQSAHDPGCPMGKALCVAKISESRLARLLALPQEIRGSIVVRLCRRLSATGYNRFDLKTLAAFILGWESASQKIAREYYREYYRAHANSPTSEQTNT